MPEKKSTVYVLRRNAAGELKKVEVKVPPLPKKKESRRSPTEITRACLDELRQGALAVKSEMEDVVEQVQEAARIARRKDSIMNLHAAMGSGSKEIA